MKWIVSLGVLVVAAVGFFVGYTGFKFECNTHENSIEAQYSQNQNVYDNGYKKVLEMAQVPDMYTDQLKSLYHEAITGRYGANGSQALLQFIQEQNPQLPAEIFTKIQQTIEIFRNDFTQAQKELIAKKQVYKNFLTTTWKATFYNWLAGYPKLDMSKYDIVTSDRTEKAFETHKDEPLDLRPKK